MSKRWTSLNLVGVYLLINVALFFLNPYASDWHYQDHNPQPLAIEKPEDDKLTSLKIEKILDEIDLAYKAREPNTFEQAEQWGGRLSLLVFFPSTVGLVVSSFFGYMGPATPAQQAFTLSVKKRYNHLAKLGKAKGLQKSGFLFEVEPSLKKKNGAPY